MSWTKWLPLRFIIRRAARSKGFLDPLDLMARLRSLAQPSEVGEPIELLRAGVVFHARGLINSKVIQNNLDWVWPYWVERQYDPYDISFMPRAFSVSHINLTHRNWTAIGYPDCSALPLVDPRGLLTPHFDGWSLDGWIVTEDGDTLLPSQTEKAFQEQVLEDSLKIKTRTREGQLALDSTASVELEGGKAVCRLELKAESDRKAWLVLALRPNNPEGISFIHQMSLSEDRRSWTIDNTYEKHEVRFSESAKRHYVSDYKKGDVLLNMTGGEEHSNGRCAVDMVTAAACFPLEGGENKRVTASIPLDSGDNEKLSDKAWPMLTSQLCRLRCPEPLYCFLYDAALVSLILHSPDDVYPGPYTYKRFWFRDAAFIINALLSAGLTERARRALGNFPARQSSMGYFMSQEGEWDSNGEALWIIQRYCELTGKAMGADWDSVIKRGARWIMRKRLGDKSDSPHAGLMPAGFSAEHLGPNDYYYWDDFWSEAGLRAAARLISPRDENTAEEFSAAADSFSRSIDRSLSTCAERLRRPAMPASPYRRLDAGAIGSVAAGYPLQLHKPDDPRLLDCVEFLLEKCFVDNAFFQDMIHSGLNAYLTLHIAQVLLRAGDPRYLKLMDTVAALASSTGQWPEAIHPGTKGGCMGDGHHVWASAEWVMMIRNCFIREEEDRLIIGAGIPLRWLEQDERITFGPAPTPYGEISLEILPLETGHIKVAWQAEWRGEAPRMEVRIPGYEFLEIRDSDTAVILQRLESKEGQL